MNGRGAASVLLKLAGTGLILLAVLAAIGALVALGDRVRFGRGIMFADVEFLTLLALACGVPGIAALWLGVRLGRSPSRGSSSH